MMLARTVPTTLAGMSALLRYTIEYIDAGREWPNRHEDAPKFAELSNKDWNYILHRTLATALAQIAA